MHHILTSLVNSPHKSMKCFVSYITTIHLEKCYVSYITTIHLVKCFVSYITTIHLVKCLVSYITTIHIVLKSSRLRDIKPHKGEMLTFILIYIIFIVYIFQLSLVNEEITGRAIHCTFAHSISHTLIGQIKSHVQILLGRVWGRARAITCTRMTRLPAYK